MSEPIETTGEITIDGELIKTANLVFHSLPENQCCRTQHENTKKRACHLLSGWYVTVEKRGSKTFSHEQMLAMLSLLIKTVDEIKLEDTK